MKPFLRMLESAEKCDELLSCLFGLNALERQLYLTLVNEELDIKEVSRRVGKERSVVYRALQRLTDHGLCRKEKQSPLPDMYAPHRERNVWVQMWQMLQA